MIVTRIIPRDYYFGVFTGMTCMKTYTKIKNSGIKSKIFGKCGLILSNND